MNIVRHIALLFFIPSFISAADCNDTAILQSLKQAIRRNDVTNFMSIISDANNDLHKNSAFFTPIADYVVTEKKKTSPSQSRRFNDFIRILDGQGIAPSRPKRTKFLYAVALGDILQKKQPTSYLYNPAYYLDE